MIKIIENVISVLPAVCMPESRLLRQLHAVEIPV